MIHTLRQWMQANAFALLDDSGDVDHVELARQAAAKFCLTHLLDDPRCEIWDLAAAVGDDIEQGDRRRQTEDTEILTGADY